MTNISELSDKKIERIIYEQEKASLEESLSYFESTIYFLNEHEEKGITLSSKQKKELSEAIRLCEYYTKKLEEFERNKKKQKAKIPKDTQAVQMDLFRTFVAPNNDASVLSNLINVWDLAPKYYVSKRGKYRHESLDKVKSRKAQITLNNDVIDIDISPAFIEEEEGFVAYFPSESEEIIEHVMRKILLEQSYGIHSDKPKETWVRYTVRMVRKELKKLGKTRSHAEILKSIEILSRCNIKIRRNGQTIQSGAIFKEKIDADNQDYSKQNPNLLSAIQLPKIITSSINKLDFKQYNYYLTNSLKTQLSRWLMRRLSLYFINAGGLIQTYEIKYSQIINDSCLLNGTRKDKNRQKIMNSINELIENKVLYLFEDQKDNKIIEYEPNGKTIKDVTYFLHPTREFVKHMKASNKRTQDIRNIKF